MPHTKDFSSTVLSPPSLTPHPRNPRSDSIGDNCMIGDTRWGGLYGIDVDFVAVENCKLNTFTKEAIQVRPFAARSIQFAANFAPLSNRPDGSDGSPG